MLTPNSQKVRTLLTKTGIVVVLAVAGYSSAQSPSLLFLPTLCLTKLFWHRDYNALVAWPSLEAVDSTWCNKCT